MTKRPSGRDKRRTRPAIEAAIAELATQQRGLVRLDQLVALGLDRRGVYAVGHAALSREAHRLAAAMASGEGSALGRHCAGQHWAISRHCAHR
jgi:hypothetical protein